jgi:hypothetical protein
MDRGTPVRQNSCRDCPSRTRPSHAKVSRVSRGASQFLLRLLSIVRT